MPRQKSTDSQELIQKSKTLHDPLRLINRAFPSEERRKKKKEEEDVEENEEWIKTNKWLFWYHAAHLEAFKLSPQALSLNSPILSERASERIESEGGSPVRRVMSGPDIVKFPN